MKKLFLSILVCFLLSDTLVSAQDYNKWSLGVNVGGSYGAVPTFVRFSTGRISHYAVNGRYMMNNRFGVMLDFGYDSFKFNKNAVNIKTNYFRSSFQGVINAGDIFRFDTWTNRIGLLMHVGLGASYMSNDKSLRVANNQGVRDNWMMNLIIGVTPQVKLSERVSLNLDISYISHANQNWQFDMLAPVDPVPFSNQLMNWSIGATIYLGKHKTHADWYPTVYKTEPTKDDYEERISKLEEQLKDDDGDGVFNYKDDEPNTPTGNSVDSRGVSVIVEKPINVDSIRLAEENRATKDAEIANALKRVNFEFASAKLEVGSSEKLAAFVKILQDNPEYHLTIEGHTDAVGSEEFNQNLSIERAKSVYDELRKQGLGVDRMSIMGYGELKPKVPNTTAANRAINRRVELIFIKK